MTKAAASAPVYGCASICQTAGIICGTALAYSNLRRVRWWLAYLDLPFMWLVVSTPIVRHPERVVRLGVASALLERLPAAAGAPHRPPGYRCLVAAAVALLAVLMIGPLALTAISGRTATAGVIATIWYGLLILLPTLTYAVPALGQHCRSRSRATWAATTQADTGRNPLLFTGLAAWPATGGGRHGAGDGFELIKTLANQARRDGAILICAARSVTLAQIYRARTGAEASAHNPQLLRWP